MRMTPDTEEAVRCTASGCSCVCFKPGSVQLRSCDRCGHGWVAHALEKLHFQAQQPSSCGPVEVALPGLVFDLSSLVLYGAQAVPVRLKILLDRLYSILTPDQVGHILHTLGWSLGDYVRGYMLQYPSGKVLDHWLMVTPEEELLILKQFLRFGETRPIVELMTLQCLTAVGSGPEINPKSCRSNISTFIERNGGTAGTLKNSRGDSRSASDFCCLKNNGSVEHEDTVRHLENLSGGQSLLLPFQFPNSAFHSLVPVTKDLLPPSKFTQCLRKPNGKLSERSRQEGGRRVLENELILQQPKGEQVLKIKADPDKPNPTLSIWHQDARFSKDREAEVHSRSSLSPSLNSSLIPPSPAIHSSTSCSPSISQKLQVSSSYSLNPLPSFSSSFFCPLPTSSFTSSLRPFPSSLCSLPSLSPAGGRKGRVCCGVCGKSFYDKGTLKIHYNAVHLKIKHRCTVAGCTMVFSSLRSRNRHSANPNPRLHMGASRDTNTHRNTHTEPSASVQTQIHKDRNVHTRVCREKEISNSLWQQEDDANTLTHEHSLRNGFIQHGSRDNTPPQVDSPPPSPHPLPRTLSQIDSALKPKAPPPPLPPLLPSRSTSLLGSPPSLVPLLEKMNHCRHPLSPCTTHNAPAGPAAITTPCCNSQPVSGDCSATEGKCRYACCSPLANQQRQWESGDPMPKKKPRKSSMPVKIEREEVERRSCSVDELQSVLKVYVQEETENK